jgi:hypothetical protein
VAPAAALPLAPTPDPSTVRARPGRLNARSVLHSKAAFYGAFVWARGVLNRPKRRFLPRPLYWGQAPSSVMASYARNPAWKLQDTSGHFVDTAEPKIPPAPVAAKLEGVAAARAQIGSHFGDAGDRTRSPERALWHPYLALSISLSNSWQTAFKQLSNYCQTALVTMGGAGSSANGCEGPRSPERARGARSASVAVAERDSVAIHCSGLNTAARVGSFRIPPAPVVPAQPLPMLSTSEEEEGAGAAGGRLHAALARQSQTAAAPDAAGGRCAVYQTLPYYTLPLLLYGGCMAHRTYISSAAEARTARQGAVAVAAGLPGAPPLALRDPQDK